jgi:hypothetical protein
MAIRIKMIGWQKYWRFMLLILPAKPITWYMDQVAVHNYTYARRSGLVVNRIETELAKHGLSRSVWLNESGVPVWDDYPGPVWTASNPAEHRYRATMQQQANFWVASTVLAWASGADVVFYHQLYDDCGNQPGGTNFPPHNGELCANGAVCAGDALASIVMSVAKPVSVSIHSPVLRVPLPLLSIALLRYSGKCLSPTRTSLHRTEAP